jgi:hypothetical protein
MEFTFQVSEARIQKQAMVADTAFWTSSLSTMIGDGRDV